MAHEPPDVADAPLTAELRNGAALLPNDKRRSALTADIEGMLEEDFGGRILPFRSPGWSGAAPSTCCRPVSPRRHSPGCPVILAMDILTSMMVSSDDIWNNNRSARQRNARSWFVGHSSAARHARAAVGQITRVAQRCEHDAGH